MGDRNRWKLLPIFVIGSVLLLVPTIAVKGQQQDAKAEAIGARQAFMKLVGWEAGPLFGMAKGDVAYDAEAAKAHAANMKTLSQLSVGGMFLAGTSKADRPGKTRARAEIWSDNDKFLKAFSDWQAAVGALQNVVGNGQSELAAGVSNLGKTCGGCHKPFRAKEF